jgi:hypothetical protein
MVKNRNLIDAKRIKNDEFYTQYGDIDKEISIYLENDSNLFRGKVIYCNCDNPYQSNFFKYFVVNFNKLGIKQVIATNYKPAYKFVVNEAIDINSGMCLEEIVKRLQMNKNNEFGLLKNGDFRSDECIEILNQSDIVITNPPFSLFREFVKLLFDYNKKFLILGSVNAITYKDIFPLIKDNKMWLGVNNGAKTYYVPDRGYVKMGNTCWFTNLEHGVRNKPLKLMTMKENLQYSRHKIIRENGYKEYDNYKAVEVPYTDAIPSDYDGIMGVPISFLSKYCPEQFEIIGIDYDVKDGRLIDLAKKNWEGKLDRAYLDGKRLYTRVFIKMKILF